MTDSLNTVQVRLATQLLNAGAMPVGIPRIRATWDVAQRAAKIGNESLETRARMNLVGCYLYRNQTGKTLEGFGWCLSQMLRKPELFTLDQVKEIALLYPQVWAQAAYCTKVPLSLLDNLFEGMVALEEETWGTGAQAHYVRYKCRAAIGQDLSQHDDLDIAVSQGRGTSRFLRQAIDISQIERGAQSDPKQALNVAFRMLSNDLPSVAKVRLMRAITMPLLATGDPILAWITHLLSLRDDSKDMRGQDLAIHLHFLLTVGEYSRAIDLLRTHLSSIRKPRHAWDLLQTLGAVVATCEHLEMCGLGKRVIDIGLASSSRLVPIPALARPTISHISRTLAAPLVRLSQLFDERNGNWQVSAASTLNITQSFPYPSPLFASNPDYRVLDQLLKARAFLECEQAFDALIILDGLANSLSPGAQDLKPQIQIYADWARTQLRRNAAPAPGSGTKPAVP